ncbi:anti-sigma factor [Oceanobacillus sp. J11TS1]|uniref:anti-sigma factor n=1 Tax=Oceanobacillus sp. J11TS1 TaxID=2807191 RepID=UPI001B11647D|nr:anti-sigma factor [Oceanobacillus sp. J11TS1]GIO24327.1 putative anti-sigma-M factor YhdL [Oceanobacillus sp. J11TS1]
MKTENDSYINNDKQNKIIMSAKRKARWNTILLMLSIIFLILPFGYLSTVIYYKVNDRANNEIFVLETIYSLTEPNLQVDDTQIELEFTPFFGLHLSAPLYKEIGSETLKAGSYDSNLSLGFKRNESVNLTVKENTMNLRDREFSFIYPNQDIPSRLMNGLDKLNEIPEGTVTEAFLSLDKSYAPKEVESLLSDYDIKIVWNAVDTGLEDEMIDKDGSVVTPIGYPEENTAPSNSSFTEEDNKDLFVEQLNYLDTQKKITTSIMGEVSIASKERLDYINQNGIKIYGVVITGPTKEIQELGTQEEIRGIHIGEVEFWNWNR